MDYEKAYKAVLKTATHWIKDGCTDKERICLESVFPELREGEDERIRKFICSIIDNLEPKDFVGVKKMNVLAWLEKQKESLHIHETRKENANSFTDEDERIRKALLRCCDGWEKGQFGCMAKEDVPAIRAYLEKQKEQKESTNSGKPKEWSEEDEKKITFLERLIRYNVPEGQYGWVDGHRGGFVTKLEAIAMLKSLCPSKDCSGCAKHLEGYISGRCDAENKLLEQFGAIITPEDELHIKPRWKPSDEQILAIVEALKYLPNNKDEWIILNTLIDVLKKLM